MEEWGKGGGIPSHELREMCDEFRDLRSQIYASRDYPEI
jgi:hypothetical protein